MGRLFIFSRDVNLHGHFKRHTLAAAKSRVGNEGTSFLLANSLSFCLLGIEPLVGPFEHGFGRVTRLVLSGPVREGNRNLLPLKWEGNRFHTRHDLRDLLKSTLRKNKKKFVATHAH